MSIVRQFCFDHMQRLIGFAAGGLYVACLYPQTWGLKRYRKFIQHYTSGFPTGVDAESKSSGQEILDKMALAPGREASIEFFTVYGQDVISKGSTYMREGVIVGIPYSFRYKSAQNVDRNKITICNKPVDWNSEAGRKLSQSMVLSEKAKKFAIARELMFSNSIHVYIQPLIAPVSLLLGYWPAFTINRLYRLRSRTTLGARFLLYSIIGSLTATFYILTNDAYRVRSETRADTHAANLSSELAEGGVEYYNQILEGNKAVRTLMGEEGAEKYTLYGNEKTSFRTPHAPLVARRDYLLKLIEQKKKTTSKDTDVM